MSEAQLIEAARGGDPEAEKALYSAHVDRVYRLAYRMSGDETLAEDFTQDTFVRAFRYLPGFRGQAAFSTWLHSIASSVVLNGLRRERSRGRWHSDGDRLEEMADRSPPRDRELRLTLHRAVDKLPENLRTVFLMHEVEGYKHAEIAGILAIPEGTAKARLSRAKERLRTELSAAPGLRRREGA